MEQIIGEYLILETIGEGASSKVKLAKSTKTGEFFAMKEIKKSRLEEDSNLSKQVKREIEIMNQLNYHGLVKLHGVLESKTKIYLVLDYVSGGELFEKLKEDDYFDEETSRKYFQQLIDAISYMHSRNAIHRDLKLENILLDDKGMVKVADFGLSIMANNSTELLKTRCGTPYYVAPEIFYTTAYAGPPADVWSCGVILFAMLTGDFPFNGANLEELAQNVISGFIRYPSDLSSDVVDLMKHIFTTNPIRRYTISDIKKHPWFVKNYHKYITENDSDSDIENLSEDGKILLQRRATSPRLSFDEMKIEVGTPPKNDTILLDSLNQENNEKHNNNNEDFEFSFDDEYEYEYENSDSKKNEEEPNLPNAFELIGKLCQANIEKVLTINKGKNNNNNVKESIVNNNNPSENIIFSVDQNKNDVYDSIEAFLSSYKVTEKRGNRSENSFSASIRLHNDILSFKIELIEVEEKKVIVNAIKNGGSSFNFARLIKAIKIEFDL